MKILFLNILTLILATLFTFLVFEGGANIFDLTPRPLEALNYTSYSLSTNPIIRFEFTPNYKPEKQPFDFDHQGFDINSLGFRDIERPVLKRDNSRRVIFLGDSTTAGNGVKLSEEIYTKRIEKKLQETSPEIEVLNMGVGGYQTLQEAETLRTKGLQYDPDLVFVLFCLNDFYLNADGGVFQSLKGLYHGKVETIDLSIQNSILSRSRLAFALYHRLGFANKISLEDQWYDKNFLKGRSPAEAGFELLAELKKKHNLKIVVLILPEFKNTIDSYQRDKDHQRVIDLAQTKFGIPVIDLKELFAERNNNLAVFSYDSCHMNSYGHQVFSEILAPITNKLLGI